VVGQVAAELGATFTAVAIAWRLTHNHITSVIIGPRTLWQFQGNMAGFELTLPADAVKRLSDVSKPGAGPSAPDGGDSAALWDGLRRSEPAPCAPPGPHR
jgi:aryl-alcohol dehydrogenase-like predicted oxidoreductase